MIQKWHEWLDMPKYDKAWHQSDLSYEMAEYDEEQKLLKKWSELGDVVYTCTRGKWSGHDIKFPFSKTMYFIGSIYMYPKYTGRYLFFINAGKKAGAIDKLREVRNPKKIQKLHFIAEKYGIDKEKFQEICEKKLKYWVLLP